MFEVKGHMGQGQRSHGWRSKVTWVKPSLKVIILAGGLTSTSSCIFCIAFNFSNSSQLTIIILVMMQYKNSHCNDYGIMWKIDVENSTKTNPNGQIYLFVNAFPKRLELLESESFPSWQLSKFWNVPSNPSKNRMNHKILIWTSCFQISLKPPCLSHIEAASIPYAAMTTWGALCVSGELNKNNTAGKR